MSSLNLLNPATVLPASRTRLLSMEARTGIPPRVPLPNQVRWRRTCGVPLYAGCFRALVILADQCVELRAELRVQAATRRGRQLRKDSDDVSDAAVLDPGAVVNPAAIDAAF